MSSKTETAFALLDEIRELQQTVDYLQLRMLRKQVAVAEIMNSLELEQDRAEESLAAALVDLPCQTVGEPEAEPQRDDRQSFPDGGRRINECKLVRQAIDAMDGGVFYYGDLANAAMKLCPRGNYPGLKRAAYHVIRTMIAEDKVRRVPGGFMRRGLSGPAQLPAG